MARWFSNMAEKRSGFIVSLGSTAMVVSAGISRRSIGIFFLLSSFFQRRNCISCDFQRMNFEVISYNEARVKWCPRMQTASRPAWLAVWVLTWYARKRGWNPRRHMNKENIKFRLFKILLGANAADRHRGWEMGDTDLYCTHNDKEKKTFKLNKKRKTKINENMDHPINPVLFSRKYHIYVLLHNYFRRHINFSTCELQISQEMPEQAWVRHLWNALN